jgi:hypothetical protein
MAFGALLGAAIGGIAGGTISALQGGSFWEGLENGAFSGAIAGIISGGMGFAMSAGGTAALSLGQTLCIGGVSSAGSTLLSGIGDKFLKGDKISWGDIALNTFISGTIGIAFAGAGYGIGSIFKNAPFLSKGEELFRIGKTGNKSYGIITAYTTPKVQGITLNLANGAGKSVFRVEFDATHLWHYHLPSSFGTNAHVPLGPTIDSIFSSVISRHLQPNKSGGN